MEIFAFLEFNAHTTGRTVTVIDTSHRDVKAQEMQRKMLWIKNARIFPLFLDFLVAIFEETSGIVSPTFCIMARS